MSQQQDISCSKRRHKMNTKQRTQWKDWDGRVSGWAAGSWMWNVPTHSQKRSEKKQVKMWDKYIVLTLKSLSCCIMTLKPNMFQREICDLCIRCFDGWIRWCAISRQSFPVQTETSVYKQMLQRQKRRVSRGVLGEEDDGWLTLLLKV